ncbi:MAG: SH3 domain-containing protein [Clostridia bacterium]|nr:SH3 domain-containing protein [Clostridia bacterium]
MFCKNCGKEVPEGSSFCPECGANCVQNANSAPAAEKKSKGLVIALVLISVLLIAAVAVLVLVIHRGNTPAASPAQTTEKATEATTEAPTEATTAAPVTEAPTQPPSPTTMPVADTEPNVRFGTHEGAPVDTDFNMVVVTKGANLNIRSGPGNNYTVLGSIPNYTDIYVEEYYYDWSLIQYNGIRGWVSSQYLDTGV